jgi:hypothetical protein
MKSARGRTTLAAAVSAAALLASVGAATANAGVTVGNRTVREGDTGSVTARFRIALAPASATTVRVDYATLPGTASSPQDFTSRSGRLTFRPGQTSKVVGVPVIGDTTGEPTETYTVQLSNPSGTTIDDGVGAGKILDNDLVANNGAEDDPVVSGGADIDISKWAETGTATAALYGSAGFPDAPLGGGLNMFAGGPSAPSSTATQTVTAPPDTVGAIDAGTASATLSALLGGFAGQNDQATVTAFFLDAGGVTLDSFEIGPVTAADRGGVSQLLPRSATAAVPVGTRKVRLRQTFTRFAGTYNDGYSDNVVLTIAGP